MDKGLLAIGVLFLIIAFLVGVKKQTWLLAGFNEKNIGDKEALGKAVGGMFFLPLAVIIIAHSFLIYPHDKKVIVIIMVILLTNVYVYINRKVLKQ